MTDLRTASNAGRFEVRVTADTHFGWIRTRLSLERTMMSWLRTAVALIGQKTLIDAVNNESLETLGRLVPDYRGAHLIRGEERQIEQLLGYYSESGRQPRLVADGRREDVEVPRQRRTT